MQDVRAAAVQMEHAPGDKKANLAKIRHFVDLAHEQGVQILCFPECCITGYWFLKDLSRDDIVALAEPVFDGPSSQELMKLATNTGMTLGAGLIEQADDGKLYNTFVVAMPDGSFARHRKIHCFISAHMDSGSQYTVFDTPHGCKVGLLICYDNNIIENVRMTALLGAELLLAPHQTGGCATPNPHVMGLIERRLWDNRKEDPSAIEAEFHSDKGRGWLMRWLPARAHDNGLFLVFANGVGVDGDEVRTGNAMILDPYGRILTETWVADDAMVVAQCQTVLREHDCTGRRWIRTRRVDLFADIAKPTGDEVDTRTSRFRKKGT